MLEYKLKDFIGYKANETIDELFFLLNNNAHYRNSYEERLVHVNYKGMEFSLKQWKAATNWGDDGISAEDFLKIEVKGSVVGDAKGLKVLILGYKDVGRGVEYHETANDFISTNQQWLYNNLNDIIPTFRVISFDNLSLNQLNVKRLLSDEQWNEFYGGDDGTFTFFINLVDGYFAKNSLSDVHYPIGDLSMDEMFKVILENN